MALCLHFPALEKTEEHIDGVKKRSYGDAFVRGNNGERSLKNLTSVCLLMSTSHVYLSRLIQINIQFMLLERENSRQVHAISNSSTSVG